MAESKLPPLAQATAGALGSSVANSLIYPLDMLSTRAQTQTSKAQRQSIVGALQTIVRKHGIAGLYQGWGADTLSNSLSNFLFFFFRSALVSLLLASKAKQLATVSTSASSPDGKKANKRIVLTGFEDLAAGALAGAASRLFTTPLSNVTVRKQTSGTSPTAKEKGKAKAVAAATGATAGQPVLEDDSEEEGEYNAQEPSIMHCLRDIVKEKGILGLWSGFETAALLSITPALTFYFTHAYQRALLPRRFRDKQPLPAQTFLTSALGNATATLVVFPLILAKSRLQSGKRGYKSLPDVLRSVWRRQGPRGLYAGLETQLVKGFLSQGTTMLVKDRVEAAIILWYRRLLLERAAAARA